jgi:hypothetical protein
MYELALQLIRENKEKHARGEDARFSHFQALQDNLWVVASL